jgi:hypothetical protein
MKSDYCKIPSPRPLAERIEEALRDGLQEHAHLPYRKSTIQGLSAETWETMDESLFRSLIQMNVICSKEAGDVILRRKKELGL